MSGVDPARGSEWRAKLDARDELELLKWIQQSGLERVARVIAALAQAGGQRGQPQKPDTLLLLQIARLKRERPQDTLHSISVEVAREAHQHRRPRISLESLVSKLEREYRRRRHSWTLLARDSPPPSRVDGSQVKRPQSADEFRVLARLVELLPTAIDSYDALLADAQKLGPDKVKLVRLIGREQVEPLLAKAFSRRIEGKPQSIYVIDSRGVERIPRNLFDRIEPGLQRLLKGRQREMAATARVGRKPPE